MPVNPIAPNSAAPPASQIGSRSEAMDRADFLAMLTAQLRAQDPLNPMSNEDFATQLATFSSLQELQGIGGTLDQSLQASLLMARSFSNTMAANLIGSIVQVEANQITQPASGPSTLSYTLGDAATDIRLEIRDAEGQLVRTITVPPQAAGDQSVSWDGLNSDGRRAPEGTYTYAVTATGADGNPVNVTTHFEGRVSEIRYVDGNVILIVGGREVMLSDVLAIRESNVEKKG